MFSYAVSHSKNPVVYNGDIFSVKDYNRLAQLFDKTQDIPFMIGRGAVADPWIFREICEESRGKEYAEDTGNIDCIRCSGVLRSEGASTDKEQLIEKKSGQIYREDSKKLNRSDEAWGFIMELEEGYGQILSGDSHILSRMKEVWGWFIRSFPGNDRNFKKLLKARHLDEFRQIEREIIYSNTGL